MAKETQRQIIARLEETLQVKESELEEWKDLVGKLNKEILELTEKMDTGFESSGTYRQMKSKIFLLEQQNKQMKKDLDKIHKLKNEKKHNERGAGRKERFSENEKETIRMYRIQGKTLKELAKMYECSIGLIHKLINE